jgi:quaternary ammonium compound-resistance protein SugE
MLRVMGWIYLIIAGFLEVGWAVGLKYSEGFTKLGASIATVASLILSFVFLMQATKELPIGTSYAVWTGIGAVGTVIMGILLFDESKDVLKFVFLFLIIAGIVGLELTSGQ